jgi:feruloyl esterase
MAAQRYPEDFDGIVAIAPTLDWNSIMIKGLWQQRAIAGTGLDAVRMKSVFEAVMRRCDADDGLKDGLVGAPGACDFDPGRDVPRCAMGNSASACLTDRQVDALRRVYAGPAVLAQENVNHFAQLPGFEAPSTVAPFFLQANGSPPALPLMAESWMRYIVFADERFDVASYDFVADRNRGAAIDDIMNPKPQLDAFRARGGRMITYWGWSDAALNPQMGIAFYEQLRARYGYDDLQRFYRLFLVPGVAHCTGGYGPDVIDALTPLIDWVEKDLAPARLEARSPATAPVQYRRSYCPYPAQTRYRGTGRTEDPASFACAVAPPPPK